MTKQQKARAVKGKAILYCHVLEKNKTFIETCQSQLEERGQGRVNKSAVVDRILTWARKNKAQIDTLAG